MKPILSTCILSRTITDDTQPSGPIQRTIEYHAPFDRCDENRTTKPPGSSLARQSDRRR